MIANQQLDDYDDIGDIPVLQQLLNEGLVRYVPVQGTNEGEWWITEEGAQYLGYDGLVYEPGQLPF